MTHDELEEYINKFHPNKREAVLKSILDSELLEKAFSTAEGKAILNGAADLITANVMKIVKGSMTTELNGVVEAAQEISTTHKLMTEWANILIRGSEHKK